MKLYLDTKLNFGSHISYVSRKISKSTGILFSLMPYLDQKLLSNLYYSLVYPYLIYGNMIWGGTYKTHIKTLVTIQKRAIRIVTKQNFLAHTNILFFLN